MARAAKLKVFRTAIGFHDAYVAAPSRKAALHAWGSDKDLFARGVAELVTDPKLTAEPLASPGSVIKRLRGTEAEQIAALPPSKARLATRAASAKKNAPVAKSPRPSRAALDAAEEAIANAEKDQESARRELVEREAVIARERQDLDKALAKELARLEHARARAADDFDRAMERWRS